MAKVRKNAAKSKDQSSKKENQDEAAKVTKQSKGKSAKQTEAEKHDNKSKNDTSGPSSLKVSKKSRSSISKNSKSNSKRKSIENTWLKGLLEETTNRQKDVRLNSGIVVRYPSTLSAHEKKAIEYVTYGHDKKFNALLKLDPNSEKLAKSAIDPLQFNVIQGSAKLLVGDHIAEYKVGSVFTVTKGTKYAVRNDGKEPSVLHLQILDYQEE